MLILISAEFGNSAERSVPKESSAPERKDTNYSGINERKLGKNWNTNNTCKLFSHQQKTAETTLKRPENGLLSLGRAKSGFTVSKPTVYPTQTQSLPGAKFQRVLMAF